ncbi:MAG: hypothetical protein DCF16_08095 [Alphaproteobacteria bacterium]|nr:MAG: hypothetical protein DCF16_08095 [Alphaproteobacteria bacterium]
MSIRTVALSAFFAVFSLSAAAQTPLEVGERLIERSGAPDRFTLETDEQSITIIDRLSGLRCSIPPNAPEMTLTASERLVQCGYSGGIYSNWMITPLTSPAGRAPLDRFVAAYALFQKEQNPTWDLTAPPPPLPGLSDLYPNAPASFRVWLRDGNAGSDTLVSLMAADINGHRVMQMIAGPEDPVTALSELSFVTSTTATHPSP